MAINFKTQGSIFESLKVYLSQITTAITDFNIGSVISSFFFAVSNAIADLYATLQNVYNATFIATATSDDLDNRVADFQLVRRIATRASGIATFSKLTKTNNDIIIPAATRVKTITTNLIKGIEFQTTLEKVLPAVINDEEYTFVSGTDEYLLETRSVYDISTVTGTVSGFSGYTFVKNIDYYLDNTDESASKIIWQGQLPDNATTFLVSYYPLSVDSPIQALGVGSGGNVAANSIINIVSRPSGIDSVINYDNTSGGTDQETDDELRSRVPLYLSSLSKATKNALRAAALSIDGVKNATVIEYDPPNGLVAVFIDDGNGSAPAELIRAVKDKIQGTINGIENDTDSGVIAAGIGVNVAAPVLKSISIDVTVILLTGYDQTIVTNTIEQDVGQWLATFKTGEQVIRAELIKVIKQVSGVYNINLDTLAINGLTTGDIVVGQNETARLNTINIQVSL